MILESADRSQRFPLDRESIFVGSSEWKSDICLSGPDIADVHCELTLDEHGVRVIALADRGVTVNGETVREASLSDGDELGIALLRFRLTGEAANAKAISPDLSRWFVSLSGMKLGPLDWDELQTMIGRGEVQLDDEVHREDESSWHALRDVLPQSGGDGLLCDDSSTESSDVVRSSDAVRSSRPARQKSAKSEAASEAQSTEQAVAVAPDEFQVESEKNNEIDAPLAPQFFIMRGENEIGPLPRQAIQELADEGAILADTPVRLEESEQWSTAVAVGFHCTAGASENIEARVDENTSGVNQAAGIVWVVFAPFYLVSGIARSLSGVNPRLLAKWGVVILIVVAVAFSWLRSWSQTAMRGTITLEGQPVEDVLIQLTGASTGDSAMGVSDGKGNFRVVTLDGELKPGLYLVTVRPLSEVTDSPLPDEQTGVDAGAASELPDRYRHINTTDATIEITDDHSRYTVELTKEPEPSRGFRGGTVSASHALQ